MKKLLFISNLSNGVSSFSLGSLYASKEIGFDFFLAANFENTPVEKLRSDEEKYNVHLCQIDLARSPYSRQNLIAYNQLLDLIRKEDIDYIHCNTPVGGLLGRLAGKKCGVKKVIYQAHGFHFYKGAPKKNWLLYYPVEKWLAHYTDALITINQEDYEIAKRKFKLKNNGKVYYVPGVGIDLKQYNSDNVDGVRTKLRTEIGLEEDATVCISMGDLIPRKNYGIAISAIGQLKEKYPKLHYLICGKGPELENLKKLAHDCGVSDKVHFLGFRSDIKDLLKASDVFLFTSLQEGLPRSTMEAMASGLPIACSRIRGNTDLIDEGKGGVLFNPTELDEIVNKMRQLLKSDYKQMGVYNLEHIKKFSLEEATKSISDVYKKEF